MAFRTKNTSATGQAKSAAIPDIDQDSYTNQSRDDAETVAIPDLDQDSYGIPPTSRDIPQT